MFNLAGHDTADESIGPAEADKLDRRLKGFPGEPANTVESTSELNEGALLGEIATENEEPFRRLSV